MIDAAAPMLSQPQYHRSMVYLIQRGEVEPLKWYAGITSTANNDALNSELLKSTYRLNRTTKYELCKWGYAIANTLVLSVSITC